jgi:hypothetical protein
MTEVRNRKDKKKTPVLSGNLFPSFLFFLFFLKKGDGTEVQKGSTTPTEGLLSSVREKVNHMYRSNIDPIADGEAFFFLTFCCSFF